MSAPLQEPMRIVVVCTANICRSPMAMALLQALVEAEGLTDRVEVLSRGVQALEGFGAAPLSAQVVKNHGMDLSRHTASSLTSADVKGAALILVMEERHRRMIVREWPELAPRVRLWLELIGLSEDVTDPYVFGIQEYTETFNLLSRALDAGWPAVREELDLPSPPEAK